MGAVFRAVDFYTSSILSVLAKNIKCLQVLYIDKTQAFWYIVNIMSNTKSETKTINHILIEKKPSTVNIIPVQRILGSSALELPNEDKEERRKEYSRRYRIQKHGTGGYTSKANLYGKAPRTRHDIGHRIAIKEISLELAGLEQKADEILNEAGFDEHGEHIAKPKDSDLTYYGSDDDNNDPEYIEVQREKEIRDLMGEASDLDLEIRGSRYEINKAKKSSGIPDGISHDSDTSDLVLDGLNIKQERNNQ